jgi:predicted Zn-dependent protease
MNTRQGSVDVGVHAFRTAPDQVYLLRTMAPAGRGGQFQSLVGSFRRLTAAEVAAAGRGRTIDVVTVRPGDTAASLAQRMAPPYNRVQSFLALNGIPDRPLQPGEKLKLIVG